MTTAVDPPRVNQRERILDEALTLMSEQGAGSTSMRQLANACGLNVAALYHYFPSKADLLRSVIEERQYGMRLQSLTEFDPALPPRERLVALIMAVWQGAQHEEAIWRLLLGEGLRGDETAVSVGRELLAVIAPAVRDWLTELFPGEAAGEREIDLDAVATVLMSELLG